MNIKASLVVISDEVGDRKSEVWLLIAVITQPFVPWAEQSAGYLRPQSVGGESLASGVTSKYSASMIQDMKVKL